MKWQNQIWENLKTWCFRYLGGLFMEEKNGQTVISLGRIATILILIQMMWIWRRAVIDGETAVQLPDGMIQVFLILASYVFGSKAVSAIRGRSQHTDLKK